MDQLTKDEVIQKFGVDPNSVGLRTRGWWIVKVVEHEETIGNANVGDLCVKTRDGASNPIDPDAFRMGNCVGTAEDSFDPTYRYYYYRAL